MGNYLRMCQFCQQNFKFWKNRQKISAQSTHSAMYSSITKMSDIAVVSVHVTHCV